MPLHLLGKKSWNVYNPENVARVRRDEAEARARDAANEKYLRDNEANDRLARLRSTENHAQDPIEDSDPSPRVHKKRRVTGEDDTERDIRLARRSQPVIKSEHTDVALFDRDGHIDLIQEATTPARDKARIQKPVPEDGGVRLSDAPGRQSGAANPWYSSKPVDGGYAHEEVSKDVWGNEDPGRVQRSQRRMDANDPLAAMKKGVRQLREADTRRQEWMQERERDLNEVEELARKERKRRRREGNSEERSLDGFDLDEGYKDHRKYRHAHRHHHHHHRSHRQKDRSRSPRRDRG